MQPKSQCRPRSSRALPLSLSLPLLSPFYCLSSQAQVPGGPMRVASRHPPRATSTSSTQRSKTETLLRDFFFILKQGRCRFLPWRRLSHTRWPDSFLS
jgi:hypothetical protein